MSGLQGIDVSTSQGDIQWHAVKASGIAFAWIKVSEGANPSNDRVAYFRDHMARSRSVGVVSGGYHYFRGNISAEAQAANFLQGLGTVGPNDLPPVLDVEEDGTTGLDAADVCRRVHLILSRIEEKTLVQPVLYMPRDIMENVLNGTFAQYPVWVASYGANKPMAPQVPSWTPQVPDWADVRFHQYCQYGKGVGGVGQVDLDYFPGSMDDLKAFIADRK